MSGTSEADSAAALAALPVPDAEDRIYVNHFNISELKSTTDDAVQNILSRPRVSPNDSNTPRFALASSEKPSRSSTGASTPTEAATLASPFEASLPPFKQSHFHTDLRLVLGFTAATIMIGTAAWAYFIEPEWQRNKQACAIAVAIYAVLSGVQAVDAYLQGHTIFIGKRKMLAKRIETERLRVASAPLPKPVTATVAGADGRKWTKPPVYSLDVLYTRHTNGGKSLLKAAKQKVEIGHMGEWFTEDGEFVEAAFEKKLLDALEKALV